MPQPRRVLRSLAALRAVGQNGFNFLHTIWGNRRRVNVSVTIIRKVPMKNSRLQVVCGDHSTDRATSPKGMTWARNRSPLPRRQTVCPAGFLSRSVFTLLTPKVAQASERLHVPTGFTLRPCSGKYGAPRACEMTHSPMRALCVSAGRGARVSAQPLANLLDRTCCS